MQRAGQLEGARVREWATQEDRGNDLWSVFNVVQEKLITGDFNYRAGGKARKGREIKNFKQDMLINKKLFNVALEYAS